MKDILNKTKLWWQKVFAKNPTYEKQSISPSHDWRVIFITTQVAVLFLAITAYFFYKEVDSGKFFVIDEQNTENEVKINTNLLQKVVGEINTREKNLSIFKQTGSAPADPSR